MEGKNATLAHDFFLPLSFESSFKASLRFCAHWPQEGIICCCICLLGLVAKSMQRSPTILSSQNMKKWLPKGWSFGLQNRIPIHYGINDWCVSMPFDQLNHNDHGLGVKAQICICKERFWKTSLSLEYADMGKASRRACFSSRNVVQGPLFVRYFSCTYRCKVSLCA